MPLTNNNTLNPLSKTPQITRIKLEFNKLPFDFFDNIEDFSLVDVNLQGKETSLISLINELKKKDTRHSQVRKLIFRSNYSEDVEDYSQIEGVFPLFNNLAVDGISMFVARTETEFMTIICSYTEQIIRLHRDKEKVFLSLLDRILEQYLFAIDGSGYFWQFIFSPLEQLEKIVDELIGFHVVDDEF